MSYEPVDRMLTSVHRFFVFGPIGYLGKISLWAQIQRTIMSGAQPRAPARSALPEARAARGAKGKNARGGAACGAKVRTRGCGAGSARCVRREMQECARGVRHVVPKCARGCGAGSARCARRERQGCTRGCGMWCQSAYADAVPKARAARGAKCKNARAMRGAWFLRA